MSHRWDCPTRWEAERQGERDQEWGRSRSSNPYESIWGIYSTERDGHCPEAAEAWRDGYRRAEYREEERREEEAAEHRAEMRRAEARAEEDYAYEMAQREAEERAYYEQQAQQLADESEPATPGD